MSVYPRTQAFAHSFFRSRWKKSCEGRPGYEGVSVWEELKKIEKCNCELMAVLYKYSTCLKVQSHFRSLFHV